MTLFQAPPFTAVKPDPNFPRPIAVRDTVFIEEMTWLEIRDALAAGKTTAIVATGGVEQNGPYLATGKHQYVLRATSEAIARKLGDALVAPLVPFVPEGDIVPPTGHMRYPGTISVSEETYRALLVDICSSLRTHGFTKIMLIGDSGGNQDGQEQVAEEVNRRWADNGTRVYHIAEYYDYTGVNAWLKGQGIQEVEEGFHDSFAITATIMTVDPNAVRMTERIAADKFRINGIELAPVQRTIEIGKRIAEFRADTTIKAFRRAVEESAAP
jgi:creatinine amidohydrolase/Fe(II)-dependent formamide hydrolase-like protein